MRPESIRETCGAGWESLVKVSARGPGRQGYHRDFRGVMEEALTMHLTGGHDGACSCMLVDMI